MTGVRTLADEDEALAVAADAVIIATPPDTHARLALAALDRGCHVYVEKPMATNVEDARALAALASSTERTVQVGFAYRFHPLWQRIEALVRRGRLTLPFEAEAVFDADAGTGWDHPLLTVSCHHVDLLSALGGVGPLEVEALGERDLVARWADGSVLRGTYGAGPGRDHARIRFGSATVEVDRRRGLRLRGAGLRAALPSPTLLRARPSATGWERSFERALAAFVTAAARGEPATPGPADGLRAVVVGVAIARSMQEGGPVEVKAGA
jgi:predicted dehydrogenase